MPPKAKRQRQESAGPPSTRSKCQGRCMKKEPGPPAEEARLPRRPRKMAAGRNAQLPAPTSRGKARKKAAGKRGRARKRGACERAGASPSPQRPAKCSRSEPFTSGPSRYSPSQPNTSSEGESSLRTQHTGCSMQLQAPDPELMTRSQAASQPQGNGPSN
ncbi:serine/arginine repetitive matrix protein 2-like [Falco naumanni]|uniref:serine/arginine repetitive matrix protein 2-like n=1 Tax=Falco naumanni TaxID=148594 RepID=UPI001ADE7A5B|nr:serine/arginine repetitive matrix protein 2-like [Falco naumanni]